MMWDNTSLSNEDTVDRVSGEGIIKARAVLFKNTVLKNIKSQKRSFSHF